MCSDDCPGRGHFPDGSELPAFLQQHIKSIRVAVIFKHLGIAGSVDHLSEDARKVAKKLASCIGMVYFVATICIYFSLGAAKIDKLTLSLRRQLLPHPMCPILSTPPLAPAPAQSA